MKAFTLRNVPPELARIIRRKTSEKRTSVNRTVTSLVEEGVGIRRKKGALLLHHDLDALARSWTTKEAAAFEKGAGATAED
jgi:hypothetical protein